MINPSRRDLRTRLGLLNRLLPALLGCCAPLQGADSTDLAGDGHPVDNVQPGLVLRHIFPLLGLYPSHGDGLPGTPPQDGNYLGEIHLYAGINPFNGNRSPEADGQLKTIAQNAAVFSILGTTYGGNGMQTFGLPDLRGALPVHSGQGPGLAPVELGERPGAEKVSLIAANLPPHRHRFHYLDTDLTGTSTPFENRQPELGLKFLISASGELRMWAGNFVPQGWAFAEGQLLPIASYPDLYDTLGTRWGGDGVSTFALPDLRGRVAVGAGDGPGLTSHLLGEYFGSETASLAANHLAAHQHPCLGDTTYSSGAASAPGFNTVQASAAIQFGITVWGIYPSENSSFDYGTPVLGEIVMYAGSVLPENVLPADGRLIAIAENDALFSLLETTYGGDGESTFALPDLRGRTALGRGTGSGLTPRVLGAKVGAETHSLAQTEVPSHQHSISLPPVTIPNPSFEQDNFTVWPGYAADNGGSISGWVRGGDVGLNPAGSHPSGSSPFANNGAIPDGSKVAFLQSRYSNTSSLGTTVVGLTPGTTYTVSFRANCRDYNSAVPEPTWSISNGTPGAWVPFKASPVAGASNPYYSVSGTFTASATFADIVVRNQNGFDTTLLLDDFKITAANAPSWSVAEWYDDASTGIQNVPGAWAYVLGSTAGGSVNGLQAGALRDPNPEIAGRLKIQGFTTLNDSSSYAFPGYNSPLGKSFHYGATNGSITLQGLAPGSSYRLLLFGAGWLGSAPRIAAFSYGNESLNLDEQRYGGLQGMRIQYTFTADSAGRVIRLQSPDAANTFHLYGLALLPDDPQMFLELANGSPLPSAIDFGFVEYPFSTTNSVPGVIYNRGLKLLQVSAITLSGSGSQRFNVLGVSAPLAIPPGGSVPFDLRYLPSPGGPAQATLRITSNDPTKATSDFTLSGDSAVTYAYWTAAEFPADPGNSGASADPDRDRIPNLLEYAFRSNPKGNNLLPFGLPSTVAGGMRRFSFPFRLMAGELTYTLQRSTDLSGWTDVYVYQRIAGGTPKIAGVSGAVNSGTQTIEVSVPDGVLFEGSNYWRLKVVP